MAHSFDIAMIIFEEAGFEKDRIDIIQNICGIIDNAIEQNNNLEFQAEINNGDAVLNIIIPHDDDISIYDEWNLKHIADAKSIDLFTTSDNNICIRITI